MRIRNTPTSCNPDSPSNPPTPKPSKGFGKGKVSQQDLFEKRKQFERDTYRRYTGSEEKAAALQAAMECVYGNLEPDVQEAVQSVLFERFRLRHSPLYLDFLFWFDQAAQNNTISFAEYGQQIGRSRSWVSCTLYPKVIHAFVDEFLFSLAFVLRETSNAAVWDRHILPYLYAS